jgi:hypothetical protein
MLEQRLMKDGAGLDVFCSERAIQETHSCALAFMRTPCGALQVS